MPTIYKSLSKGCPWEHPVSLWSMLRNLPFLTSFCFFFLIFILLGIFATQFLHLLLFSYCFGICTISLHLMFGKKYIKNLMAVMGLSGFAIYLKRWGKIADFLERIRWWDCNFEERIRGYKITIIRYVFKVRSWRVAN